MLKEIVLDAIEARRRNAHAIIAELCNGKREWLMSIPPRDSDPDIALDAALRDIDALLAEVRRLRAALEDSVRTAPLMGERWAYEAARQALAPEAP